MGVLEIYDNYSSLGICSRPITEGQEYEMVKKFIDYKKNSFQSTSKNELAIFVETKINNSYPDIIFVEYNPNNFERWNSNRSKLKEKDLKLLHFIFSKKNTTSQKIMRGLSIQYKALVQSIEALLDAGLLERKDGCWVVPNRELIFGVNHITAVEAKISKWDEVIQQAVVNKTFASESFILSKKKRKPDQSAVEKTNSFGIGIYLYDDIQFSCYSASTFSCFPLNYNSVYLNECIGKIMNSQEVKK